MENIDFNSTKLTQALVKCKSVTPADDGALEIVEKHLSSIGFKCTPLLFSDPNSYDVKNLFASIGSSGRHLAFAGHTDVVPAGNEESWRFPPFSATIEGDKLYGRGTEDMKSNIACFMSATNKFIDKIIIGVDSSNQLDQNVNIIKNWNSNKIINKLISKITVKEQHLLSPVNW